MKTNLKVILGCATVAIAALGWNYFAAGAPLPTAQAMTTLAGKQIKIDDYKGKVVLVNFWATSCTGCMAEMPGLVKAQQSLGSDKLVTIAVAMSYDNLDYIQNYLAKSALPFEVVYDQTGAIAKAFGEVQLTPTSFVIGKDGRLLKKVVGELSEAQLVQMVNQAI
ncbi:MULTISPECIES: TlpA disulfide reductase family protein [Deefgea]|uniref:Redoxin family protein n=1 Tax=Deefgea chitinilytica TaxID=570276 RepID=A0ABS2C7Y6_9NEIS|nr:MULTISPECIES: TlpA disulfide reductase family protein [Deefgea]MBM5570260.1 redoxin family protein [Deefgea chitinilytica]MBM9887489.1 TlpA family protein disulfide reductase [Deefgea sp. CFH1-16]